MQGLAGGELSEVSNDAARAFVVGKLDTILLQTGFKVLIGNRAKDPRGTSVRDDPGHATNEVDGVHIEVSGQREYAVGVSGPVEIGLLAFKKDKIVGPVIVEDVGGRLECLYQAVFYLDVGPEKGGHFHRAREVINIEILSIDFREFLGLEFADENGEGSGRDIATVHPTRKAKDHAGVGEFRMVVNLQVVGRHGVTFSWTKTVLKGRLLSSRGVITLGQVIVGRD